MRNEKKKENKEEEGKKEKKKGTQGRVRGSAKRGNKKPLKGRKLRKRIGRVKDNGTM